MRKGIIDLKLSFQKQKITSIPLGLTFIAAINFDYCAESYGKGTGECKNSEKHWSRFWGDYFIPSVIKFNLFYYCSITLIQVFSF